jgi:predicted naringenin-chalcone synthase
MIDEGPRSGTCGLVGQAIPQLEKDSSMSFAIIGLGTALPPTTVTQAESVEAARRVCCRTDEQAALVPVLYRQTRIDTRRTVLEPAVVRDLREGTRRSDSVFVPAGPDDETGPTTGQRMRHYAQEAEQLAIPAARQALERSGLQPTDLTHLVTVSCTGFVAPGVDVALMSALGLSPTTERTHVGFMGCHGAFNGLRVARAFTDSDADVRVLVCAVELCSLHYFYGWDPEKMVANALFADGAAAVVGVAEEAAPADSWRLTASGSCLFPASQADMTWKIGDHGFEMSLSRRVPDLIGSHLRTWLEEWLDRQEVSLHQVGSWAVHPGGPRILTAVQQALGLSSEATAVSREVLAECGNLSSPTVLFLLDRLQARRAPRPCVALGFGPGLFAEAMLLQ